MTRPSRKGVIAAPLIFFSSLSLNAVWIAFSINYPSSGLLFGTATSIPFSKPNFWCSKIISAIFYSFSSVKGDRIPEEEEKNDGKYLLW